MGHNSVIGDKKTKGEVNQGKNSGYQGCKQKKKKRARNWNWRLRNKKESSPKKL